MLAAATDPVAVVATMSRLGVPKALRTLVEAESLLNDGTGLVLFALAVRATSTGIGLLEGAALFAITVLVSAIVGVAGAVVAARAIAWSGERTIQLATTLVLAYGTFQLAAAIGLSGILATLLIQGTTAPLVVRRALANAT